jgi:YfiH family protein
MITYDSNQKVFLSTLISDERFFGGFGTKELGDGRKVENIFNFLQNNYSNFKKVVILEQIHSTNIAVFNSSTTENLEKISEIDGIVTKESGSVLTVITADCSPIIFVEKNQGIIGISHNGWRGSVKRLVQKMVEKIIVLGGKKDSIYVAIGPSIGECCYNIDEDRYYQFKEEFDGYSEKIFHRRQGKLHLNLTLLNYLLLLEKGVKKENIDCFPFCTRCDKKRFFSFRRDKKSEYGEMFSFIVKS